MLCNCFSHNSRPNHMTACLDPGTPLNGDRSVNSGPLGSFFPGTVVTFTCHKGYSMDGGSSTTCVVDGSIDVWNIATPACMR